MSGHVEALIVSYDSAGVIADLLLSLRSVAPGLRVAIREHAADAAAVERLARATAEHPDPVRIEHDPSNPGFGAGCNALARSSTADWLVFLNPDVELVAWPWTDDATPPSGRIVGPEYVGPEDPARRSTHDATGDHVGVDWSVRDEITRSWLRRRGERPAGRGFVSGAALLVDRASFERLGGFDERYFLFYEDIDLCLRANASGVETHVEPRWRVRHARAHSTSERRADALRWSYESARRFHGGRGSPLRGYAAYVAIDSAARAIWHLSRKRRELAQGYRTLARRAARDVVGAGRVRG